MNKQKIILLVAALAVIGGAAAVLNHLSTNQRLGQPGVKTTTPQGKQLNVEVLLPEKVLNYDSKWVAQPEVVTNVLPADTSFGQREYVPPGLHWDGAPGGPEYWRWVFSRLVVNVVLMGTDRTSLHKPQFCLEGQGWRIDDAESAELTIPIDRPQPYELPVIKLVSTQTLNDGKGNSMVLRGIYVYWFVADGVLSGDKSGAERMWGMAKHLLKTGELQRWAYVSCFAICPPGEENATYERMKEFIAASVPEFQLTPKPSATVAAATP
jgi:hypothetical protein